MESLRIDVDVILDMRVPEHEYTPADLVEDTILTALFKTTTTPLPPPHYQSKRHCSSHPSECEGDRARKR